MLSKRALGNYSFANLLQNSFDENRWIFSVDDHMPSIQDKGWHAIDSHCPDVVFIFPDSGDVFIGAKLGGDLAWRVAAFNGDSGQGCQGTDFLPTLELRDK